MYKSKTKKMPPRLKGYHKFAFNKLKTDSKKGPMITSHGAF